MRNEKIRNITFCSIIIALILLLTLTGWGYFPIGPIPVTIVHIPVLIGAIVLGKKYGLILGGAFGLTSMILSFFSLTTQAPFTNPLLSVLPRMLFGFIVFPIYSFLNKKIKVKAVANVLSLALSTLFHTVLVLTILYFVWKSNFFFGSKDFIPDANLSKGLFQMIYLVFISNGIIEIALSVVIGTPISIAMDAVLHRNNQVDEEENDVNNN